MAIAAVTSAIKCHCTSLEPDCTVCLALLNMIATGSPFQMHQRYSLARERCVDGYLAMTCVEPLRRTQKLQLPRILQFCILLCRWRLRRSHLLPCSVRIAVCLVDAIMLQQYSVYSCWNSLDHDLQCCACRRHIVVMVVP